MKRIKTAAVFATVLFCLIALATLVPGLEQNSVVMPFVHAQDAQDADQQSPKNGSDFGRTRNCSAGVLRGRYGLSLTGTILGLGPAAEIGSITFDGYGAFSGKLSANFAGQPLPRTATGTYVVNPDCTGKISANITPGGPVDLDLVMVDSAGKKALVVVTSPGLVLSGSLETQ